MLPAEFRRESLLVVCPVCFFGIVLVVLIFFIACTPLRDRIESRLPHSAHASFLADPTQATQVEILGDGTVELMGRLVSTDELLERLHWLRTNGYSTRVVIAADRSIAYSRVRAVLGVAALAGVEALAFRTAKYPATTSMP